MRVSFDLSEADLKHFRRIMKEVRERSKHISEEEIVSAAEELLNSVDSGSAPDFVVERIGRLRGLIDLLVDQDWGLAGKDRERVIRGLAYFAEPEDIIPDKVPVLGFLDDAIMVELVVTELAEDLQAYADFCHFRAIREERFGKNEDPEIRREWVVSRRQALHQRMRRRRSRRRSQRGSGGRSTISLW